MLELESSNFQRDSFYFWRKWILCTVVMQPINELLRWQGTVSDFLFRNLNVTSLVSIADLCIKEQVEIRTFWPACSFSYDTDLLMRWKQKNVKPIPIFNVFHCIYWYNKERLMVRVLAKFPKYEDKNA